MRRKTSTWRERGEGRREGRETHYLCLCARVCALSVSALRLQPGQASGEQSTVRAPLQPLPPLVFVIVFKLPGQQQQQQQQLGTIPHGQWASALRKVPAAAEGREGARCNGVVRTQAKVLAKCSRRESRCRRGGGASRISSSNSSRQCVAWYQH